MRCARAGDLGRGFVPVGRFSFLWRKEEARDREDSETLSLNDLLLFACVGAFFAGLVLAAASMLG